MTQKQTFWGNDAFQALMAAFQSAPQERETFPVSRSVEISGGSVVTLSLSQQACEHVQRDMRQRSYEGVSAFISSMRASRERFHLSVQTKSGLTTDVQGLPGIHNSYVVVIENGVTGNEHTKQELRIVTLSGLQVVRATNAHGEEKVGERSAAKDDYQNSRFGAFESYVAKGLGSAYTVIFNGHPADLTFVNEHLGRNHMSPASWLKDHVAAPTAARASVFQLDSLA